MSQGGSPTPLLPHLSKPRELHEPVPVALPSIEAEKLTPVEAPLPPSRAGAKRTRPTVIARAAATVRVIETPRARADTLAGSVAAA